MYSYVFIFIPPSRSVALYLCSVVFSLSISLLMLYLYLYLSLYIIDLWVSFLLFLYWYNICYTRTCGRVSPWRDMGMRGGICGRVPRPATPCLCTAAPPVLRCHALPRRALTRRALPHGAMCRAVLIFLINIYIFFKRNMYLFYLARRAFLTATGMHTTRTSSPAHGKRRLKVSLFVFV